MRSPSLQRQTNGKQGGYRCCDASAKFNRCKGCNVGRGGRVAEGGGLLNRYRALKPYRGFESPSLRHFCPALGVMPSPADTPDQRPPDADWSRLMALSQTGDAKAYRLLLTGITPYMRALAYRF